MKPEDVPPDLITAAETAEQAYARSRRPDGGGWSMPRRDQIARMLAAVLPEIKRQARAEAADEIEALGSRYGIPENLGAWRRAAEIARGER
jgi:hypothetical protein